jgi:PKD repeat protein
MKTDLNGNLTWLRYYSPAGFNDYTNGLAVASDGYLLAAQSRDNGWGSTANVIKTRLDGTTAWEHGWGAGFDDKAAYAIAALNDGYIVVGAWTSDYDDTVSDFYRLKINLNGGAIWEKWTGGTEQDRGHAVAPLADGFLVAGHTDSYGAGSRDGYLVKLDMNGNIAWQRTLGGTGSDYLRGLAVTNGMYAVVGTTSSYGAGGYDAYLHIENYTVLPYVNFWTNATEGIMPLTVQFNDKSLYNVTAWQWNFGDSTLNSTVKDPVHTYATNGTYNVTLTTYNADGNSTLHRTNYIVVGLAPPVANFTVNVTNGTAPLTVQLNDTSSNSTRPFS